MNAIITCIYAAGCGNDEIIHLCEQNYSTFKDAYEVPVEFYLKFIKLFYIEMVKLLLVQEGIDVNAKDNRGWTALMNASENGRID